MATSGGVKEIPRKNPDSLTRMQYLHQAAAEVGRVCPVLGASLALQAKQIGLKAQIKIHRDVKRGLCKGCCSPLLPGQTADLNISGRNRSQKKISIICQICATRKAFPLAVNKNVKRPKSKKKKKNKNVSK